MSRPLLLSGAIVLSLLCSACSQQDKATASESEMAAGNSALAAQAPFDHEPNDIDEPTPRSLTSDDLDAFEKGIAQENSLLKKALEMLSKAANEDDKIKAMYAALPERTEPQGATAAGLDIEHYRRIKETISEIQGALQLQTMMQKHYDELDTHGLDAEHAAMMKAEAKQMINQLDDPWDGLDNDVIDAYRARAERLTTLSMENVSLLMKLAQG